MSVPVEEIHDEMEQARVAFNSLVATASANDLRRGSNGTRWSNWQLLFHMVFGYLVVLRLLPLVRIFGRLPDRYSRRFAAVLDAVTPHYHVVNYLGSVGGGQVLTPIGMARLLDRTLTSLHGHVEAEHDANLACAMHFPTQWDPYFHDMMTLADVYHFGTQHFQHHQRQLTLGGG